MSSIKSQVALATNIPSLSSSHSQKEYNTEESQGRQNSFGNNRRGNMKGKHLTRSHAMRESTSPPRTPTPRGGEHIQTSPNGQTVNYQQIQHQSHTDGIENVNSQNGNSSSSSSSNSSNINNGNNKLHAQSTATRGNSPIIETPAVIVTSQHNQQHQQQHQQQEQNVSLCNEAEFPKLTPPKSTKNSGGNGGNNVNCNNSNSNNNNNNNGSLRNINHTNGVSAVEGNKIENNNNNNKKIVIELKSNVASSATQETHKSNHTSNSNSNSNSNNNSNNSDNNLSGSKHQQFSASNALHQALNISESNMRGGIGGGGGNSGQQTTQTHYNAGMSYQLNATDMGSSGGSSAAQQIENRGSRNDSQNSNVSNMLDDEQQHYDRIGSGPSGNGCGGGSNNSMNKKHRANSNPKNTKPRLKNISSSSGSADGSSNSNNTSGFISRENSCEQFTDHGGTDLLTFFKETLNKSMKDRHLLLKIEKDLVELVQDKSRSELRFPSASSYNRMLIHRTAAFFGMDHNVDSETQQCVIVGATKSTRIPEIRFKSLVRDHREDSRKSILKRDTHSFDEARQSGYLCPDRGMLDRKAKSFEEREEDYERARSRIFNRSQNENSIECVEENYVNMNWSNSANEQSHQSQQQSSQTRSRSNGKILKMQTSNDGRDGRSGGAVPKAHSFGGYGGGPGMGGGGNGGGGGGAGPLLRGDSTNSNKNGGVRVFGKQDSAGSTSTPWRLSPSSSGYKTQTQSVHSDSVTPSPTGYGSDEQTPEASISSVIASQSPLLPATSALAAAASSVPCGLVWAVTDITNVPKGSVLINPHTLQPILNQDGSIYHFDPSNLPSSPVITSGGVYHQPNQISSPQPQSQSQPQSQPQSQKQIQPTMNMKRTKTQSISHGSDDASTATLVTTDTVSEMATQTVGLDTDSLSDSMSKNDADESYSQTGGDECDNAGTTCLSITTTTSTKNYDRIEVQKFKNQATSPNIPNEDDDLSSRENSSASTDNSNQSQRDHLLHDEALSPVIQTPMSITQHQQPQHQQQQSQQQQRETPHSARSTPFSVSDQNTKRTSEEAKTTAWTYTHSYQAPDGSTVFHTTTTPNGTPFCATTYQQGPDGSVYAIPQGMVYAYPPPVEGEVQSYFMPVFDPAAQQRSDAASMIPGGSQAVYPAPGGTATMVPVAAAYPAATQFASSGGAPIYPGHIIYSSEQFPPGGATVTAAAPPSGTSQLQQIPMTTYPFGYPYPYNGYWGQTMTTYYVPQQAITNAVTAAPILAPPPPPPSAQTAATSTLTGSHVAGGVSLPSGIITATATAGPTSNANAVLNNAGMNVSNVNPGNNTSGFQAHNGTTYFGTGRIKRPAPSHFSGGGPQSSAPVMTAIPSNGGVTTTYQLGHAVPTLTLAAAPPGTAAAPNDLSSVSAAGPAPTATMYALPQHAALFPANVFPYAPAAAAAAAAAATSAVTAPAGHAAAGGALTVPATATVHPPVSAGTPHVPQSNPVIAQFYAQPPPLHGGHVPPTMHVPGPAAIPIVDPATLANTAGSMAGLSNSVNGSSYNGGGSNNSQSASSTPHSLSSSQGPHRNPPLFSTPPILGPVGITTNNGHYTSNSTPHYYNNIEAQTAASIGGIGGGGGGSGMHNSPHNSFVSSHDKRNSHASTGGKKLGYSNGGISRQNSNTSSCYNAGGKPLLLSGMNDVRSSPNNGGAQSSYQPGNARQYGVNKRGGDKPQVPLLSGPPPSSYGGTASASATSVSYNTHHVGGSSTDATGTSSSSSSGKPPVRLNAAAASFRQKPSGIEYRRSVSQRNSPGGTTSSSNENSNNNSPNSIAGGTPITNCYTAGVPPYMSSSSGGGGSVGVGATGALTIVNSNNNNIAEVAPQHAISAPAPASLYITTRGAHIPSQVQHGGALAATAGGAAAAVAAQSTQQAAATAAMLGGAAAAAAAALGTYNPGAASGVYFKYGQTYFSHPSVALPNSRRSPSTDLRPPMAQMAGMYPAVNMMITAPPRHTPGRHPNPNYKGTRPR